MPTDLDKYYVGDATHNLTCYHCIGQRNRKVYYMPCIVIPTKGKKTKVVVFGERYWKGKGHVKKIRYVEPNRLSKILKIQ